MNTAAIKDRLSRFWTYRWSMTLDGRRYDVRLECRWHCNTFVVASEGEPLAPAGVNFYAEPFRLQELVVEGAAGRRIIFRTAPASLLAYGLEVTADGNVVYRSHPEPFAALAMVQRMSRLGEASGEGARRASERILA